MYNSSTFLSYWHYNNYKIKWNMFFAMVLMYNESTPISASFLLSAQFLSTFSRTLLGVTGEGDLNVTLMIQSMHIFIFGLYLYFLHYNWISFISMVINVFPHISVVVRIKSIGSSLWYCPKSLFSSSVVIFLSLRLATHVCCDNQYIHSAIFLFSLLFFSTKRI